MSLNKITVDNTTIHLSREQGDDIDTWLKEYIGFGNYQEWIGLMPLPYRSFSFYEAKYETLFILKWG